MGDNASSPRSFRLSASTCALLDDLADVANESRNSLVERMLAEALRTENHPLIRFRLGASGRREPMVTGTRLTVRQLVRQVKDAPGGVQEIAEIMELPASLVRAAMSYYAEFQSEVDADIAWATKVEQQERERWEREQALTA